MRTLSARRVQIKVTSNFAEPVSGDTPCEGKLTLRRPRSAGASCVVHLLYMGVSSVRARRKLFCSFIYLAVRKTSRIYPTTPDCGARHSDTLQFMPLSGAFTLRFCFRQFLPFCRRRCCRGRCRSEFPSLPWKVLHHPNVRDGESGRG